MTHRIVDLARLGTQATADARTWFPDLHDPERNGERITEHYTLALTAAVGELASHIAETQHTRDGWKSPDLEPISAAIADAFDAILVLTHHHGIDLLDAWQQRRDYLNTVHNRSDTVEPGWPDRLITDALDWLVTNLTQQAASHAVNLHFPATPPPEPDPAPAWIHTSDPAEIAAALDAGRTVQYEAVGGWFPTSSSIYVFLGRTEPLSDPYRYEGPPIDREPEPEIIEPTYRYTRDPRECIAAIKAGLTVEERATDVWKPVEDGLGWFGALTADTLDEYRIVEGGQDPEIIERDGRDIDEWAEMLLQAIRDRDRIETLKGTTEWRPLTASVGSDPAASFRAWITGDVRFRIVRGDDR